MTPETRITQALTKAIPIFAALKRQGTSTEEIATAFRGWDTAVNDRLIGRVVERLVHEPIIVPHIGPGDRPVRDGTITGERPSWDGTSVTYRQRCAFVRRQDNSVIVPILDKLEADGWPSSVESPAAIPGDITQALYHFNGKKVVHLIKNGRRIAWRSD